MGVFPRICILDDHMIILHRCFTAVLGGVPSTLGTRSVDFSHDKTVYLGFLSSSDAKKREMLRATRAKTTTCFGGMAVVVTSGVSLCINKFGGVFLDAYMGSRETTTKDLGRSGRLGRQRTLRFTCHCDLTSLGKRRGYGIQRSWSLHTSLGRTSFLFHVSWVGSALLTP